MSTRKKFNHNDVKRKMNIQQWLKNIGGLAAVLAFASHAWAAGVISSITSGVQSGEIIVKVELSEPLSQQPEGFVIQNPARIALDLPGVTNGMNRSLVDLSQGNLRSIAIAEANDRTRLILNLGSSTTYSTEVSGNTLLIRLSEPRMNVSAAEEQTLFSPATAGNQPSTVAKPSVATSSDLQNIDFRTSTDGAGALIVTLPSDQTAVDIRQQGGSLVVDVLQTTLPPALRRVLDVSDFKTPMKSITAEQVGANVRLTIVPVGHWDQSAYQAQNQFVLELHPVKEDPSKLIPGSGYKGERLSLSFQDVEVRTLLQVIANFTEFNVVTSDTVRGNLTLRLQDVPWDQALDIIMQARGLAADKTGNVLWIAPREEIDTIRKDRLLSFQENEALAPLRTQIFQLNYAQSEAVVGAINSTAGDGAAGSIRATSLLSERGSIIVDPRTNKLIVTDVPSKLENLAAVLAQIDIPVRQVNIEARIVEATDGWGRNLGVRLSGVGNSGNWTGGGTMPAEDDSSDSSNKNENKYSAKKDMYNFFNLPAIGFDGNTPGYFSLNFSPSANKYLQLELQALESERYGRKIASPSLMTADMVTARVEQGIEIPYQESSASGATTITFKPAILKLEVTPRITPNGNVDLKIEVTQDSKGVDTVSGPAINTNRVNTQITIENGGTVVIGGIFKEEEYSAKTKIPLLGDIPLIGHFFRSTNKSLERTELLIFITPRIVDDGFGRGSTVVPNLGGSI